MANEGNSAVDFSTPDPNEERLEETKQLFTLYFLVASVIMGVLLFVAIRKSIKLCFFDYFYSEPVLQESEFKPASVFTVPSVLLSLQKRYEEMSREKKRSKKKGKKIPVQVTRREDDRIGLTTEEAVPSSGSGSQSPEEERVLFPSTASKRRPSLLEGSDLTLSRTTSLERRDDMDLVNIEEGNDQVLPNGRIQHSSVVEDEVEVEELAVDYVDEVVAESHAPNTEEDSEFVENALYEAAPRRDSPTELRDSAEVAQRESAHSFQEAHSDDDEPASTSGVAASSEGYPNKAFADDESENRASSPAGTDHTGNSTQNLLASLNHPSPMSRLRKVRTDSTSTTSKRASVASHGQSTLSRDELKVFVPGAVASIAKEWQKRRVSRTEVAPTLPGMERDGDEGSQFEEEGVIASFKAEEPAEADAEAESGVEEEDEVFMVNPPASDISYGSRRGSQDRYGDVTVGAVESMRMASSTGTEMGTAKLSDDSPKDTPTPSLLMGSDLDKVGIFGDMAGLEGLESSSEFGNSSAVSGEGSEGSSPPKGSKLGQFGRFNMDWGASKMAPKSEPEPPKRKSRYKKNVNPTNQRAASHRAQKNWDKMMKEMHCELSEY